MKNIEVEARSFINPKKFRELRKFFDSKAKFIGEEFDQTVYFKAAKDLRIRQDGNSSRLILKEGKVHDKYREEIDIKLPKESFFNLEKLITSLGFKVATRWYRTKRMYKWKGINVYLWRTKGYGYIIELEKMSDSKSKERVHLQLLKKLKLLNIEVTPRREFEEKFSYYRKNWQKLTNSGPKKPILPK